MNPKLIILILIVLLILIGLSYMWPFTNQPKILETRDFSCPGMTGFTFKYPVFEGWEVKETKPSSNECVIELNSPDPFPAQKSKKESPKIRVSVGGPAENSMMRTFLNPQSIGYRNYATDGYMFLDPVHKRSIFIELDVAGKINTFPKDLFFKTVIESFILTK